MIQSVASWLRKNNLSKPAPSLGFWLKETDGPYDVANVAWAGTTSLGASDLLRPSSRGLSKKEEAMEWLKRELADGPQPAKAMGQRAKAAGISGATLRRARKEVANSDRAGGIADSGEWVWSLKDAQASSEENSSP